MHTLRYTERNIWTKSTLSFSFSIWTILSSLVFSTRRAFTASKDSCKGQRDTCTYVRTYVHVHNTYTSPYVRTYVLAIRTYVCTTYSTDCTCTYVRTYIQTVYVCTYVGQYSYVQFLAEFNQSVKEHRCFSSGESPQNMYVRMYICTCTDCTCMYIHTYVHMYRLYMYVCTYVHIYRLYMYVCTYVCTYIQTVYVCTYVGQYSYVQFLVLITSTSTLWIPHSILHTLAYAPYPTYVRTYVDTMSYIRTYICMYIQYVRKQYKLELCPAWGVFTAVCGGHATHGRG